MIHFGVHNPRVYEVANGQSDPASICSQCLVFLLDADRNGVLLVDDGGLMLSAMASAVAQWPEKYKKKGQELLQRLTHGNRIVRMSVDCGDDECARTCGVTEALTRAYDHDYLVTPSRCLCSDAGLLCQSEKALRLEDYCLSFPERFREPTLVYGPLDKVRFENEILAPVFRTAKWARIVDKLVGSKAKQVGLDCSVPENYNRGLRWVLGCLARFSDRQRFSEATIVSAYSSELNSIGQSVVRTTYERFASELGDHCGLEVGISLLGSEKLPHQRYLITDQVALDMGRGYDLIDRRGGLMRDVSVSLLSAAQLKKLTRDYPFVSGAPSVRGRRLAVV